MLRLNTIQVAPGSPVRFTFSDTGSGATNFVVEFAPAVGAGGAWSNASGATLTSLGGGTGFIRRQNIGSFDPVRPDRVRNEITAFSTRFWFFDVDLDRYRFNDVFISSGVQIEPSPNPDVPPTV